MKKPRLFTYCMPFDDGAAPNPFWGVCTLTICKPAIRRIAQPGDWIVGTGSKNTPCKALDFSNKVIHAMKVTEKLTLQEYDKYCKKYLRNKIPDWNSKDTLLKVGDCIYDFSTGSVKQREGVHSAGNMETDLSGQYALLSKNFYYFGANPIDLPDHLKNIVNQGQGHKSDANDNYVDQFVQWIENLGFKPCTLHGLPEMWDIVEEKPCADKRCREDDDSESKNDAA